MFATSIQKPFKEIRKSTYKFTFIVILIKKSLNKYLFK